MANLTHMVPIPGSRRGRVPEARLISRSDPVQRIKVSVYARVNPHAAENPPADVEQQAMQLPAARKYLKGAEFDAAFGADPQDLKTIADYAKSCGLTVLETSIPMRRVLLEGTIGDFSKAFSVELNEFDHPKTGRFRGREGEILVPPEVLTAIDQTGGVLGLDTRLVGQSRRRRINFAPLALTSTGTSSLKNPWPGTFFPPQVAQLYNYPADDGAGQNIAILAFNSPFQGGYSLPALQSYFKSVNGKIPAIAADVVVHGPGNNPGPDTQASGNQGDATGEVMLDMCVVGSVAPGATIHMYFTVFTAQGWVDAIHQAITDNNNISVISVSYGNPEDDSRGAWTAMAVKLVNTAFQAAAAKGITICCASGDDGSSDQGSDGKAHADFPASSPYVLAVGGTKLVSASAAHPAITSETVWNEQMIGEGAGGGGISAVFAKPSYQSGVSIPPSVNPPHRIGRGVPDVAAVADPNTGVVIMHVSGKHLEPIGGTSASAPLWSALIARVNQSLKARCGFLNPVLYTRFASGVLRDITSGNNGAYAAGPGWDACTGLGAPDGQRLLNALSGKPLTPHTMAATPPTPEVLRLLDTIEANKPDRQTIQSAINRLNEILANSPA